MDKNSFQRQKLKGTTGFRVVKYLSLISTSAAKATYPII